MARLTFRTLALTIDAILQDQEAERMRDHRPRRRMPARPRKNPKMLLARAIDRRREDRRVTNNTQVRYLRPEQIPEVWEG